MTEYYASDGGCIALLLYTWVVCRAVVASFERTMSGARLFAYHNVLLRVLFHTTKTSHVNHALYFFWLLTLISSDFISSTYNCHNYYSMDVKNIDLQI